MVTLMIPDRNFCGIHWQNEPGTGNRSGMPGKRSARSRSRGSWAPRLVGTGFAMLLAVAGVAAYLIIGGAHDKKDASVLPTRVLGTQAVNLVDPGPRAGANPVPGTLVTSHSDLVFVVSGPAGVQWTSDQMAGATYILIYLRDGLCLASRGSLRTSTVALEHCNLQSSQRWLRQHLNVGPSGLDYWQLRNLADNRCLAVGRAIRPGEFAAQLAPCAAAPGWRQQVVFMTAS